MARILAGAPSIVLPLALVALGACGDDMMGGDTDAAVSTSAATTKSTAGTDSAATSEATEATEATSGTTGVPFEPYAARGLEISKIEANAGVAVPIGLDGGGVDGGGRNAYVVSNRNTLIRVFLDVGDDWVERDIEARLTLIHSDGSEEEFSEVFTISEDTRDGQIVSGPYFGLDAESVRPGVKYRVSLWETAWGYEEQAEPDPPPMLPVDGTAAPVGVEDSYLNMRVVLVPVDYSFGTCSAVVDPEAIRQEFDDAIYQQNPLSNLEMEIHEPFEVTYDMNTGSGVSKLVNEMSQLRAAEGAGPEVYYFGVFDNCGKCVSAGGVGSGCMVGLAANITGDSKSDAWGRASVGQLNSGAASTFVHEVGHTQGRRHIYCPSAGTQAAGTDPSYPYGKGEINIWGFGVRDFGLRHPTATADYMSYCSKSWCSDWQWNATYQRIKTLSSWEGEDAGAEAPEPGLLIGAIDPDGTEDWWTVPGNFEDRARERSGLHRIRFAVGGEAVETAAEVSTRPHYPTMNIVAPLPADFDAEAGEIRFLHGDDERVVTVEPQKILHQTDRLRTR